MATGKQAIDRLLLDKAFSGKFVHTPLDECWTAKCDEKLLIVDDIVGNTSRFATDNDDLGKALMIVNENKREIILLAIDHKLLTNYPGGEADCAVFDEKQFRFVEFKTNQILYLSRSSGWIFSMNFSLSYSLSIVKLSCSGSGRLYEISSRSFSRIV